MKKDALSGFMEAMGAAKGLYLFHRLSPIRRPLPGKT
jgi:hypothetical protein